MKNLLITLLATVLLLTGCSVELQSLKYTTDSPSEGVVYNLPKNLIKVEIIYNISEPFELVNGVERKMEKDAVISVDKPVKVISTLVPDETQSFVLTGDRITNNFFTKSTLDFNLTKNGILKGIDADIDDQSVEFGEKVIISAANIAKTVVAPQSEIASQLTAKMLALTTSLTTAQSDSEKEIINSEIQDIVNQLLTLNYDSKLMTQIIILDEEFVQNNNKDSLNIIASKIKHLQGQIKWYQENNKTFYKKKEVKYTAVLDPFFIYNRKEIITTKEGDKFTHEIIPTSIFPPSIKVADIPSIKVSLTNTNPKKIELPTEVNGVVVRHPASTKIDLELDNSLYGSEIVYLAQLGNISIIPVKSKRAGKVKTSIKFDETTGAIAQHRIEASSGSEKIGKSLENSTKTIQETIDYLQFEKEIKRLEAIKKESQLENDLYDLSNTELSREFSQLELTEKITLLKKKIDELNESEPSETEFDKTIKQLEEQQKLLELELLIKELKDKIENVGGN